MASTTDMRLRPAVESQPQSSSGSAESTASARKRCAACGTWSTEDTRQVQVFATLLEMMEAQRRA
jgi:Mg-chelatase subunit ChlD